MMMVTRTLRLVSGLVLMAFVGGHLLVVAAGLASVDAIEASAAILMAPWTTAVGSAILALAAGFHVVAGLVGLAGRRSLALRRADWIQLALGLAVLPMLVPHILTVRIAGRLSPALAVDFPHLLAFYWQKAPGFALQQLLVVVVVWIHASIGFHGWASLKPWWPRVAQVVTPLLFAIPILALLGFVEAGKAILARLEADPAFADEVGRQWDLLQSVQPDLQLLLAVSRGAYGAALALAVLVLAVRLTASRSRVVEVAYDGGLAGTGRRGLTILEISRLSHVPHASVCSGRGRCGTCRVRVLAGLDRLSPRDEVERRTLGPGQDRPEFRLACRARVYGEGVSVERLLPVDADASAARRPQDWLREAPPSRPAEVQA